MNCHLSIILPIHNARNTLIEQVEHVLEVATETVQRFEVMIVDDGSDDGTEEIAAELAARYPQVRVACHGTARGFQAAVETGLRHTCGEIVLVKSQQHRLRGREFCNLWELRHDPTWVSIRPAHASPARPAAARLFVDEMDEKTSTVEDKGSIEMIRRTDLEALLQQRDARRRSDRRNYRRTDPPMVSEARPPQPNFAAGPSTVWNDQPILP